MEPKQIKNNRYFTEYSVIAIVAFLLLCQIILSLYIYNMQNIEAFYYATLNSVHKLLSDEESSVSNISSLAATISVEEEVMNLMQGEQFDFIRLSNMCQRLRKYVALVPDVETVYLYSNNNQMFYDIYAQSYDLVSAPSVRIMEMRRKDYKQRKKYLLYKNNEDGAFENYNYEYIFTPDHKTGDAIIIKLKFKELFTKYADNNYKLIITDGAGNVVFGGIDYEVSTNISDERFFQSRSNETHYLVQKYKNKQSIITYLYSEYVDRWYITITPYSDVFFNGLLNKKFLYIYVSIVIAFIIILRCLSWFKKVKNSIQLAIKTAEYNRVKKQKYSNDKYLFDYMNNAKLSNIDNVEEYLPNNFDVTKDNSVLIIKLNSYIELSNKFSTVEMELYKYGIDNMCSEIFNKYFSICLVSNIEDDFLYIIGNIEKNTFFDDYNKAAEECMLAVENYIGAKTSYFTSESRKAKDLFECYKQVNEVKEYAFIYETNAILDYSVINDDNSELFDEQKSKCKEIKQSILKNTSDEADILNLLIDNARKMSVSQCKEIMWYLLFDIHNAVEILKKQGDIDFAFDTAQNLIKMDKANSLHDVGNLMLKILEDISSKRQNMTDNKQQLMIKKCLAIIEKDFSDKNLCLESIADKIGFSPNYLGRKFKQCTNDSISDKITERRLIEAEKLLINTDQSIKIIMDSIGFSNSSYFTVTFRKRYSVTPTVYRSNKR